MPYRRNYPATVQEVLNPTQRYKPAALRAVRAFARSKPWQGSIEERMHKFLALNRELALAYGIREPHLMFLIGERETTRGNGSYRPLTHTITLEGKLSVLTYLHEFAHARGADERQACRWSINLFARCFPRSFAHCRPVGHTMVRE